MTDKNNDSGRAATQGGAYAAQRASIPCGPPIDNFPPRPEPAIWHGGSGFYNIYQLELFANATHAMRASHGQAPTQPAPVQEAQEPVTDEVRELIAAMVSELRGHRWCGDCYPENGWQGVNRVLADYARFKRHKSSQPAHQQGASPTAGMNIAQRILHVGGRNNAAGYVEFGSIQAVEALVRQVLRDLQAPQPSPAGMVNHKAQAIPCVQWQCGPQASGFTAPKADQLQPVVALQEKAGMYADDFAPQADSGAAPEGATLVENGYVTQAGHDLLMAATRASATLIHPGRVVTDAESPTPQAADSALEDAARLDWLEADEMNRVLHLGKSWYTRAGYGSPYRKRASLREAIDTARAAQEGK